MLFAPRLCRSPCCRMDHNILLIRKRKKGNFAPIEEGKRCLLRVNSYCLEHPDIILCLVALGSLSVFVYFLVIKKGIPPICPAYAKGNSCHKCSNRQFELRTEKKYCIRFC